MELYFDILVEDSNGQLGIINNATLGRTKREIVSHYLYKNDKGNDKMVAVSVRGNKQFTELKSFVQEQYNKKRATRPVLMKYGFNYLDSRVILLRKGLQGLHDFLKGKLFEIEISALYDYEQTFKELENVLTDNLQDYLIKYTGASSIAEGKFEFDMITGQFKLNDEKSEPESLTDYFSSISLDPFNL